MILDFVILAFGLDAAAYIAIASLAASAAGTAYSYYAAEEQKDMVKQQGEANAKAAELEAQRQAAELAENQRRKVLEQKRFRAIQASQLATTGFATDTGTPLSIVADTYTAQARELADLQYGGDIAQRDLNWQRQQSLFGAQQQARAIGMQQTAGLISGVGDLAYGAFSVSKNIAKKAPTDSTAKPTASTSAAAATSPTSR